MTGVLRKDGCFEIRHSTLVTLAVILSLLSIVAGASGAWAVLNSTVRDHHGDRGIHLTEKDVTSIAPSRGEYAETLKRIDKTLDSIDGRLNRIEDKVYGR